MGNHTYGQYLKWIGANFSAITLQDLCDLAQFKDIEAVIEDGKITDFVAKEVTL